MRRLILASLFAGAAGACATASKQGPVTEAEPATDPEAWRAQRPQPAEPVPLQVPTFQKVVLENGLTVLVSERHDLPLVSVQVAFQAGSAAEPDGKEGLAQLTYQLLLEGAGERNAAALDKAFADLGTSVSASVGADGALVGTQVLTQNLDPAMALLADVVQRPRMEEASFQHRKDQALSSLAYQVGNPRYLGNEAMAAVLFGESHPYGGLSSGTPATVGGLTLADAKQYWARASGPKAAAVILTGDVRMEQALELVRKHFGAWEGNAEPVPMPPAPELKKRKQVVLVPKPGLGQTLILVGRPAIAAGHPDEYTLSLANSVYGGFFGSRLNMNLREDKGYTYGARSSVDARRGVGPWIASTAVRADVTGPALAEIMRELEGMQTQPITERELAGAREGQVRSIPGWFESVGSLASAAAQLYWLNLPLEHYDRMISSLQEAPADAVQAAAERYFAPEYLQIVLVGDPEIVRAQVGELGLGEIVERHPVTVPSAERN